MDLFSGISIISTLQRSSSSVSTKAIVKEEVPDPTFDMLQTPPASTTTDEDDDDEISIIGFSNSNNQFPKPIKIEENENEDNLSSISMDYSTNNNNSNKRSAEVTRPESEEVRQPVEEEETQENDKWVRSMVLDSSNMLCEREFSLDDFSKETPLRNTSLVIGTGLSATIYYVSLDFLAEVSDYFSRLKCDNLENKKRIRIRIGEENPEYFLVFLRALTPCPIPLSVDEFNVHILSELSLNYGAWHLFMQCEKYMCDNIKQLEEDLIVQVFKAVYRPKQERSWLCERLYTYVAENLSFDQFDELHSLDVELTLDLYKQRARSLALKASRMQDEISARDVTNKTGRKRPTTAAAETAPAPKLLKPEPTIICPRCCQDLRAQNPRHGLSLMNAKCFNCKRHRCGPTCRYNSTCKEGYSCIERNANAPLNTTAPAAKR